MFLKVKRAGGDLAVMERQACYNGAYGARAMHSLQNFGKEEPAYGNNAYSFSATYLAGQGILLLYAHHLEVPINLGERPTYYMTELDTFNMAGKCQTYIKGLTALGNTRDLEKRHRESSIKAANTQARQGDVAACQIDVLDTTEIPHNSGSSPSLVVDGPRHVPQTAHDQLQQDTLDKSINGVSSPEYLSADEDSHDQGRASAVPDPSISPIRPTSRPNSPPSSSMGSLLAKSRTSRSSGGRAANRSVFPEKSAAPTSHWVEPYRRDGKICFEHVANQTIETRAAD
ncbi:hypothetical protein F4825DRAFT_362050 [Nemania diffusa]|nr:hypothetical protein F4825DRAFT_362050 [Nemania diffusa]